MALINTGKWVAIVDEYLSNEAFDTKEEAMLVGRKEAIEFDKLGYSVEILNEIRITENDPLPFDIIKFFKEAIAWEFDEFNNWLSNVKKEHQEELEKAVMKTIVDWMNKHSYQPDWFATTNGVYITLEEEHSNAN